MSAKDLPLINACLNSASTILIVIGLVAIYRERKLLHIGCMTAALITSAAFLTCYIAHKILVGPTSFTGEGWIRPVYFTILLTHTILAVVNLPLIFMTVIPAVRARFDRHRRMAKWTYPVWLYVSITGVIVYLMLYQWFPGSH